MKTDREARGPAIKGCNWEFGSSKERSFLRLHSKKIKKNELYFSVSGFFQHRSQKAWATPTLLSRIGLILNFDENPRLT